MGGVDSWSGKQMQHHTGQETLLQGERPRTRLHNRLDIQNECHCHVHSLFVWLFFTKWSMTSRGGQSAIPI